MRFWHSIVGKIWGSIILLLTAVLVATGFFIAITYGDKNSEQITEDIHTTTEHIGNLIESGENLEMLDPAFDLLDESIGVIVEQDGEVIASKQTSMHLDDTSYQKLFSNQKFNEHLDKGDFVSESYNFYQDQTDETVHMGAQRFKTLDGNVCTVYVYRSYGDILEITGQVTKTLVISGIVAVLVTSILSYILSSRMSYPLREMKKIAIAVSKGNFDNRVPTYTHDEIGDLGIAFNKMAQQLKYNISALRQEKEQLSNILVGMADGVIKFNIDKTIILSNPPAEQFLHDWFFSTENSDKVLIPPKLDEMLSNIWETREEQVGEISFGDQTYVAILTLLYNGDDIRSIVTVIRDMTEEKRLEKMKTDFVNNVSHELRTPISMLQGYSEAIIDGVAQTDEEVREFAQIIYDESLRIGRLVNDMLDLARMEAGFNQLDKEREQIAPFLDKVVSNFEVLAKENNVKLRLVADDPDLEYTFDQDRMEQVLVNLIMNAIRHTGREDYDGVVEVHETANFYADELVIKIIDNGSGIAEEDIPFLFERFYKADKARVRGKTGTGIGLSIVKNIVEAHNGKISVESNLGIGSTFIITLPLSTDV
ncbi:ATP-binding protein [Listeria booriae]|uniref:histidine kinase n=1 Tax=Listeria booriae TaxID=1552123 RepID=A0A7X0ZSS0_9LIST|nr:ATP-binding protein [Listeria booriae]MBC2282908.1 cell wall metabolism sensor histidine kinase WalK [Listeria booriae]MBC2292063.1 cell wall metabolism sensor histidine kinase WalK [Listeria booriae]MBC2303724.1 cell wall metabolism sensor histidine kinase WalK [Listeria booriae]MBC2309833.1 cell wall metabolism sensor histidine kinase WalK [Listeria booriae]